MLFAGIQLTSEQREEVLNAVRGLLDKMLNMDNDPVLYDTMDELGEKMAIAKQPLDPEEWLDPASWSLADDADDMIDFPDENE